MDFYSFSEDQALTAVDYYREYFKKEGLFDNQVYIGIPEMLEELTARGVTLAVATSKPTVFAEKIIEHFGLSLYFREVVGSNLDNSRSDKAEVISHALSQLGCDSSAALMIGDRRHDIIGAEKNSMDSVGVLYGYGGYDELSQAGAGRIAETVPDLAEILLCTD